MKGRVTNDPRGDEDRLGDVPDGPDNSGFADNQPPDDDGYRDDPRDEYTSTMHLPDEGDGAQGEWIVCDVCESSWRPGAKEKHEADCPVMLLRQVQAKSVRLRRRLQELLTGPHGLSENEELVQLRERVGDLENVLGMIPRDQLAEGIQRAMNNAVGDAPVLVKERLDRQREVFEQLCDAVIEVAGLCGRSARDLEGYPERLSRRLDQISGDLSDVVKTAREGIKK